ncbi:MAG: TolC family protein [Bacteroidetes bacterium]|nr:TolC family protein [Bacteroidota bacterium]
MKNNFRKIVASILLVSAMFTANAQSPSPSGRDGVGLVNLETVLKLAGANNLTIQEYQLKYQHALAEQSKAKEWYLPNIYFGASTHYLNGAAMNTDGQIFTDVNRNNLWTGLGIGAEIDFSKGFYSSLAAKQKAKAMQYQSTTEKNKMILQTVQTYFDLQVEQLKYFFLQQLVNQSNTISQQIKIKVDAGLLYQSDYLLSQSNYNHLKISMLQTKIEWQKKSAELVNLLNLENNISLVSGDTTLIPLKLIEQKNDTATYKNGFEKRAEYLGLSSELQSFQTLRKTANQGLLLPKLRAGFDNGAFGAYTTPLYNTYQFNASLVWNLPLGRFTYKGDLKKYDTQILIQQNEIEQFKNQFQQEISIANSQLQIAQEQMTIAKHALQSSTEALNQSIERQKLGTAKPFEVFQIQQFFLQAQTDYVKTVIDYNKVQYALWVALGNML